MTEITAFRDICEKEKWVSQIDGCGWSAGSFLAQLLRENRLEQTLGEGAEVYLIVDGEKLVSFATLSEQDCIDDKKLSPWIGFVFTSPEYRGRRHSGTLIDHICEEARRQGRSRIYIATDHDGLYEKFGFTYIENRTDIYGTDSKIYYKELL